MHINSQKRMELSFIFLIFNLYKVRIYKKNEGDPCNHPLCESETELGNGKTE
jgi:hypothetical protein